jgi:DNA-binding response OmpR family regulator
VSLCKRSLESPQGLRVDLTSLEFEFLKIFSMADVGESISRKKIVQAFNEDYLLYDQNRLDTLVRRLRQKIKLQLDVELPLNTVRIKGFSFDEVLILDR